MGATENGLLEEYDDEGDWDDENESVVRAKWSMDGAKMLTEAAEMLRAEADGLLRMEKEGWQLMGPVEDDYGFIRRELVQ